MKGYDIVIQAGQSNAEGCGKGTVATPYAVNNRVWHLEHKWQVVPSEKAGERPAVIYADEPFTLAPASERVSEKWGVVADFSLTFSKEYIENGVLKEGRRLLIVRGAVGGTGFCVGNWRVGDQLHKKLRALVDYALALEGENRVVALLWHQGECDAFEGTTALEYEQNFTAFLRDIRQAYGEDLPVVAGDFVQEWKSKNLSICTPITETTERICVEDAFGAYVHTDGLASNDMAVHDGEDIHFCREAQYELGKRYFQAFARIYKE